MKRKRERCGEFLSSLGSSYKKRKQAPLASTVFSCVCVCVCVLLLFSLSVGQKHKKPKTPQCQIPNFLYLCVFYTQYFCTESMAVSRKQRHQGIRIQKWKGKSRQRTLTSDYSYLTNHHLISFFRTNGQCLYFTSHLLIF